MERAKIAFDLMPKNGSKIIRVVPYPGFRNNRSSHDAGCDERGVRRDRLLDVLNPIRIAAVLSHTRILEWLLSTGWSALARVVLAHVNPFGHSQPVDMRRKAVHDVFIDQSQLPACARGTPNAKCLELILQRSTDLCWHTETVISAGKYPREIFGQFARVTDLLQPYPPNLHPVKGPLYVEGKRDRTVGELSLQHALRAGRFDNARILLARGVKLAEAVRTQGFFHDDPSAMAILRGLRDAKLPGLSVVSRSMQVLYWVQGDDPLALSQTRALERAEKAHVWKHGVKGKLVGPLNCMSSARVSSRGAVGGDSSNGSDDDHGDGGDGSGSNVASQSLAAATEVTSAGSK